MPSAADNLEEEEEGEANKTIAQGRVSVANGTLGCERSSTP